MAMEEEISRPKWEFMVESPTIDLIVPTSQDYLKKISKNLGTYEVGKSSDNRAEVTHKGNQWDVILDEQKCSCRGWQVTGLPCVHAAAFIASTRDANWENYVDAYFTIEKFRAAYAKEIAPMPGKNKWVHEPQEKIYPPTIRRPAGRPKKKRIVPADEPKRRHKCQRCGMYGHHQKTCKDSPPVMVSEFGTSQNTSQASTSKRRKGKDSKARQSKKSKSHSAVQYQVIMQDNI